ncbi:MAG: shikimate dehydrogenase [Anaerolineaceae bacterium]|nr:shikimate dehydrogenase [Anaerolineaceae bacterium]
MGVNYKAEVVGVFGFPIAENPTGIMQEAAFAEIGLNWRYLLFEVKPEGLADAVKGARAMGMQGFNLTIPHKLAVMALLDEIAPDAAKIGAVNTVRRVGDRLIGENTDGKGFVRGLREQAGLEPAGKKVVILGAGGAARAIAVELALAGAEELTIVNRSEGRGSALAADLRDRTGVKVHFEAWSGAYQIQRQTNILVNATSIGLYPDVDGRPDVGFETARADLLVCDVIPNPPETRLIKEARQKGFKVLTGLPMLVCQGVIGFEMWTGQKAPENVMKAALAKAFGVGV